ncbi:MAG: hypothetical protein WCG45_00200 [bacterium]
MEEFDVDYLTENCRCLLFQISKADNVQIISLLKKLNEKEKQEFKRISSYLDFIDKGECNDGYSLNN